MNQYGLKVLDTGGGIAAAILVNGSGAGDIQFFKNDNSTVGARLTGEDNANSYFNSGGNLGIGDTSPPTTLTVNKAGTNGFTSATDALRFLGNNGSSGYRQSIGWIDNNTRSNATVQIGYVGESASGPGYGHFFIATHPSTTDAAPTERLRVTSGGHVGIGTADPDSFLHVWRDAAEFTTTIQQNQGNGHCLDVLASASDDNTQTHSRFRTDAGSLMELLNNGTLHITTGTSGLTVKNKDTDTVLLRPVNGNDAILITDDSEDRTRGIEVPNAGGLIVSSHASYVPLTVKLSGTEKFRVGQDGHTKLATGSKLYWNDGKVFCGGSTSAGAQGVVVGYGGNANGAQAIGIGYAPQATGAQSISMGYNSTASGTNSQAFGYNVSTSGNHSVIFGYSQSISAANTFYMDGMSLLCEGDITANYSDIRLKENIRPIEDALTKVDKLSGVLFDYKEENKEIGYKPFRKSDVGLIAQEVEEVLPDAVNIAPFDVGEKESWIDEAKSKSGENYLTVRYERLVPLLIQAIKELNVEVKELKEKISDKE
jgi:hypothetical protein